MAEKLVKYKLLKFGNGWITPPEIYEGGKIWSQGSSIADMILVGKIANGTKKKLPEGVIEVIKQSDIDDNDALLSDKALKSYKKSRYEKELDPLALEAMREKLQGDDTKWNEYMKKHEEIHSLTSIPSE